MIRPLYLVLFLCFASAAPARVASADDSAAAAKAKRHYERGQKLFALQQFDKALDQFQRAFDAEPIPDFLFNIGQCQRNLGDYEAAIFSFKQYVKLKPGAPNRESVEDLIRQLEDKKATQDVTKPIPDDAAPAPPPRASRPIYKKWWFWTGIAVVGAAGGVAVYAATSSGDPSTGLGIVDFE